MPRPSTCLNVTAEVLKPGAPLTGLKSSLAATALGGRLLARDSTERATTGEFQIAGGRWLRFSQSATRDQGLIVVFGDVTVLKEQEATLRETNLRLDAALDNMSQGLCLFDGHNRLEVVNRRFLDIFGLAPESRRTRRFASQISSR